MGYTLIPLDAAVHPHVVRFVRERVEPMLRDVRAMFEFPRPGVPEDPGFNLTAAITLCSVIGGLSRVFYNHLGVRDNPTFKAVANRYAVENHGASPTQAAQFADDLYGFYRNSLIHGLGLTMSQTGTAPNQRWTIVNVPGQLKVAKLGALSEAQILELEQTGPWPSTHDETLGPSRQSSAQLLRIESLYCGIRRLVKGLADDASLSAGAVAVLTPWATPLPSAATHVQSGSTPTYSRTGIGHTLGGQAHVVLQWPNPPPTPSPVTAPSSPAVSRWRRFFQRLFAALTRRP